MASRRSFTPCTSCVARDIAMQLHSAPLQPLGFFSPPSAAIIVRWSYPRHCRQPVHEKTLQGKLHPAGALRPSKEKHRTREEAKQRSRAEVAEVISWPMSRTYSAALSSRSAALLAASFACSAFNCAFFLSIDGMAMSGMLGGKCSTSKYIHSRTCTCEKYHTHARGHPATYHVDL